MKFKGRKLAFTGAFLQLSPLLGIVVSVVAMIGGVFEVSDFAQLGTDSTSTLEGYMALALYAPFIGIIGNLIGFVCLLIALFVRRYRAPWFFCFMIVCSVLLLIFAPLGTVIGIVVLVYIIPRKDEFYALLVNP